MQKDGERTARRSEQDSVMADIDPKIARIHARDKYCDSRTATNIYPPDRATTCTALLIRLDVLGGTDASYDNRGQCVWLPVLRK